MDERLRRLAAAQGGVFTPGDALSLSIDDNQLARVVRAKEAVRLQRNLHVIGAT